MNLLDPGLSLPILGAIVAGALIGAEREYRSSPAGFRTHILVSLACALLMLAAVHQVRWLSDTPLEIVRIDPVRMAHGVLTGIGFLCGGVIFREGFGVRGLTTAASLWMTASLGILFGVGFFDLAIAGSIATFIVLAAVRASERFLPQRRYATVRVHYHRSAVINREALETILLSAGLMAISISQKVGKDSQEFQATVSGNSDKRMDLLASILISAPDVIGFEYEPHGT
ncbi:MgtC/SapB family protein [Sphingobium sp. YG1]|jgi:putative Mg2+ transporter-C (MgtC) family protein|uniref:MgtC/SapB family protein n=1 Tax=Sphingobium sp. YG1 TaxID=2082188 RepID=UPI000DBAF07F|nr:MgtC/SapB family protein [Sphingobium sp. YG1]BBC99514.1 putative Mg2+ transporter-C (MgtC) family protein [Sphingobium sp. YG1]